MYIIFRHHKKAIKITNMNRNKNVSKEKIIKVYTTSSQMARIT